MPRFFDFNYSVYQKPSNYPPQTNSAELSPKYPQRLSDNLQWQCSSCRDFIPASETHLHILSCLMSMVKLSKQDLELARRFRTDDTLSLNMETRQLDLSTNVDRSTRPKTKRLDRPSPNVKHPVINTSSEKTIAPSLTLDNKAGKQDKGNQNLAKSPLTIDGSTEKRKTVTKGPSNIPGPCKTCERPEQPERFHSHAVNGIKTAIIRKTKQSLDNASKQTSSTGSSTGNAKTNETSKAANKNCSIKCNVCNKSYESSKFQVHECQKKPNASGQSGTNNPGTATVKSGCDPAGWEHFKSKLAPCRKCGRTFFAHRIAVHERVCKSKKAEINPDEQESNNQKRSVKKTGYLLQTPVVTIKHNKDSMVLCSKCSRKFSSNYFKIHEMRCKQRISLKELKILHQTAEPEPEWQNHLDELVPCSKCKRTFFPDRLPIHEPNCKAEPVLDNVISIESSNIADSLVQNT